LSMGAANENTRRNRFAKTAAVFLRISTGVVPSQRLPAFQMPTFLP